MRVLQSCVIAVLVTLCLNASALAGGGNGVSGLSGEFTGISWEHYAHVTVDSVVVNADLGDQNISLQPGGVNTCLYSRKGSFLGSSTAGINLPAGCMTRWVRGIG